MKGGGKDKQFIKDLETLLENIKSDNTFEVAGVPMHRDNLTKEQTIRLVTDALTKLRANKKIEDSTRQILIKFKSHYHHKREHESTRAYEYEWGKNSKNPNTLIYRDDITRKQVEDLFTRLQELNIFEDKPQWRDWLEKYIALLTNYEYIDSLVQQDRINYQLKTMEVAANAGMAMKKVQEKRAAEAVKKEAEEAAMAVKKAAWAVASKAAWVVEMRGMARETGDEEAMAAVEAAVEALEADLTGADLTGADLTEKAMAAEAAVTAAVRGGEAAVEARMMAAMLAAAEATGDEDTMAMVKAKIEMQADLHALRRQDEEQRAAAWKSYDEDALMPPPQSLPPPRTRTGGKSKRIIKINVKSKKKRRNRY
jgi:hypothetical protein